VNAPREIQGLKSTQVACGYYHSIAISSGSGDLYSWGKNDSGQLGLGTFTQRELSP
jgi:alpha-tubulin suppressor-like RCC1 family protein